MSNVNEVTVTGKVVGELNYSHTVYGENFYTTTLECVRQSGTIDQVPLTVSDRIIDITNLEGKSITVKGHFRSFNKHEGEVNRLILSVFVTDIQVQESIDGDDDTSDTNELHITGFITKEPGYRMTPLGREVCDLLIASNRQYGKTDYIPCICWGRNARFASSLSVGTELDLYGRIQSREYTKKINEAGDTETRIAYEVSINKLDVIKKEETKTEE